MRWVLLAIAIYFTLAAVMRVVVSRTPELDEAEQVIQTQVWSWGYGPQPPLYTWVQKLFFSVTGVNIAGLALLNGLILFGTCAVTYLAGKELFGESAIGVSAALSLFFIPQFVFAAQNDLTHSDMAIFFTAATFLIVARLLRERTTTRYLALGLIASAGILSKYNYALLFVVLIVALLSWPDGRRLITDKRFVLAVVVLLLLLAPHLYWIRHHPELTFRKIPRLHASGEVSLLRSWADGFGMLAAAVFVYVLPLALAWVVALGKAPLRAAVWKRDDVRATLLRRVLWFSLLLYVAAILLFRAKFKERWIQPNLYPLPLLVAFVMYPLMTAGRLKKVGVLAAVIGLGVSLTLGGRVVFAETTGKPFRQNMPYDEVARRLDSWHRPAAIIAEENPLGAAFIMMFRGAPVLVPDEISPRFPPGPQLIVWEVDAQNRNFERIVKFMEQRGVPRESFSRAQFIEAPLKYAPSKKLKAGYLIVPMSESH